MAQQRSWELTTVSLANTGARNALLPSLNELSEGTRPDAFDRKLSNITRDAFSVANQSCISRARV